MNPTLAECRSIQDRIYKAYLAISIILILDRLIYGNMIEDLLNSYSMGTDQYPQTRSKMHNTIVHWRNRADHYGICAPPGAVVLVQDNEYDSSNGKMHTNDFQR